MNSLTEKERSGLEEVFLSISTPHKKTRMIEQMRAFLRHCCQPQQPNKPKERAFSTQKGLEVSKLRRFIKKLRQKKKSLSK